MFTSVNNLFISNVLIYYNIYLVMLYMLEGIFRHPPQGIISVSDHIFIHGPHTSPAFFFRVVVAFQHGWFVIAQDCWSDIRFPVA